MSWTQRLKRVFSIEVNTCVHCGGAARRSTRTAGRGRGLAIVRSATRTNFENRYLA